MHRALSILILIASVLLVSVSAFAQDAAPVAYFRLAHNAADVSEIYLLVNGSRTEIQNVGYRGVSEWYTLRADNAYRFEVGRVGSDPQLNVTKRLPPGSYTTLTVEVGESGRPSLRAVDAVARVRVAHLAQGVGTVDVFVNGERTELTGLAVGNVSDWVVVPLGTTRFGVGAVGESESYTVTTNLRGDTWTTIAAVGTPDASRVQLRVLSEDYGVIDPNFARVSVFHAVPNLGSVNTVINGVTYIQNLGFPGTLGGNDGLDNFELPSGNYVLQVSSTVNPASVFFDVPQTRLFGGRAYLVAAYGLPGNAQLLVTGTDVAAERGEQ